jgi:uncharacterized protein (TIGR02001 family)
MPKSLDEHAKFSRISHIVTIARHFRAFVTTPRLESLLHAHIDAAPQYSSRQIWRGEGTPLTSQGSNLFETRKTTMRKLIGLAAAAACVTAPATAEDELSITSGLGFESRYVFRGVQFAETSIQPSVTVNYGGFHIGAWFNLPIGDDDFVVTPGGEELDLVIGWGGDLGEIARFDVGVTYYLFPDLMSGFFDLYEEDGDGLGANTLEPYLTLSFDLPLSPAASVFHDFNFDTTTFQGALAKSFPLGGKTSLDLSGTIGYVLDDDPGADYLYGAASANVSYAVSDDSSLYLGVRYGGSDIAGGSIIDDSILGAAKSAGFWWGVGASTTF